MAQTQRQPITRDAVDGHARPSPRCAPRIANKPKTRGTLRALGLRKIGDTNVLPDRPEIRGMLARVPHLVDGRADIERRRSADMRVDELAPAPGVHTSPRSGSAAASAARAARPPAPVPRASSRVVAARSLAASKAARCRLKQRVPKLKGFNNPFRVEYSPVNLDQIAALEVDAVDPDVLVERGLVRKGTLVKVLGRGEITAAVHVTAHAVSKAADSAITAAGGSVTRAPLPFKQGRPPVQGNQFANR